MGRRTAKGVDFKFSHILCGEFGEQLVQHWSTHQISKEIFAFTR